MAIRLTSLRDKTSIIDLLQLVLQQLMLKGVARDGQEQIMNHIAWMRAQSGDMDITCRLETYPETKGTSIQIFATFAPKAVVKEIIQ